MKTVIILSILFCAIALPAVGELTDADLDKIRLIVKEEVKAEVTASETRMREYINVKIKALDQKIDAVDKSLTARIDAVEKRIDELDEKLSDRIRDVWLVVLGLIGLIVTTVAIPQIIIAFREKGRKEMQTQIDQLHEKIEAMNQSINQLRHQ